MLSAAAVAWQFAAPTRARASAPPCALIAVSFFGLALFVSIDSVRALLGASEPEHSTVGIVLAAVSLAVMPLLSWFERRTGRELGSASAVADSKQTLICAYLSAALLVGPGAQQPVRLGMGRPVAGTGHRRPSPCARA